MDTYEEKYKEIVGQIKKAYLYAQTDSTKAVLKEIFPELKESEDEKILVIIKHCIECRYRETSAIQGISMEQCFAWLEKQGEKKPADSYCQENCKGFQETGKCFADGECKAKREAEQKPTDKIEPKFKVGEKELTNEELCEGLIRGMINEHNRVTKEVLRNEYEKGRDDVLAKIDAIDVDEMVYESGATSRVTQYWYANGVNDVIKKLKEEQV